MTREEIETRTRQLYDARLSNDAAACLEYFTEQPVFSLAGAESVSSFPARVADQKALSDLINTLVSTWQWQRISNRVILIDDNRVAVRYLVETVFTPTGDTITTELMDYLVWNENGLVDEFTEFADTALIESLASSV